MGTEPVLVAGTWRQSRDAVGEFAAFDPQRGQPLPLRYPVSGRGEAMEALAAAREVAEELVRSGPEPIARFLELYARRIEARADALVETAHQETALPMSPRLRDVELPRATSQLRQAAEAARERSWCRATIDTKNDLRSMYRPLGGAVIVFGPNNFPFAFNSVAGGDFAAAVAAGNPVIAKANTGHPGTTKLLAEAAREALLEAGLPAGTVQLIYRVPADVGCELVAHPLTGATGFTGSKAAGLRLKAAADAGGRPIYLEMGSVNPVFVLSGALEERREEIARQFSDSCSLGAGQFCTKPGLVIVPEGPLGEAFLDRVRGLFESNPPGTLLGRETLYNVAEAVGELRRHGADLVTGGCEVEGPRCCYTATLLRVGAEQFLADSRMLQTEAFGTVGLAVLAANALQMRAVAEALDGSLTGCIYSHSGGGDDPAYRLIEPVLRRRVGRLLNDRMPTGVAVSPAMNHGGPYPATGHPGFTAVGIPAALLRFAALHCYDHVRPHRLPPELGGRNPTGRMWRLLDGEWTQRSL